MLGYSEAELLSMSVFDIHPPDEVPNALERIRARVEEGLHGPHDTRFVRKDGEVRYVNVVGNPITYQGRNCVVGFFRDVTEKRRAEEALAREHHTLKHLLQASDHERQVIAYEIHDGLAQQLAGAIMQFQAFQALNEARPNDAVKVFDAGMTMLQQGHYETRRLIAGVRPPILDEEGVVAAVGHLVSEQSRLLGAKIEYRSQISFARLVPTLENAIYRIAQEALTNACRHSRSENILVSLSQCEDRVRIEVCDWGIGFDPKAAPKERYGLEGIRQRARLLGGKCHIQSKVGRGTRVIVEVPAIERGADE